MASARAPQLREVRRIFGVRRVVAVSSGKGGVGKSTVTTNLAVSLARLGERVGILDADMSGPSIPTMMGVEFESAVLTSERERPDGGAGEPAGQTGAKPVEGDLISPVLAHGVRCMSMGLLMPPSRALAWRGPMVIKGLRDLLHRTDWSGCDTLLVDLPPGTGDTHLSMVQECSPLSGFVAVTTPQRVALADVRRGADLLANHAKVPFLGVVENMAYADCSECGTRSHPFGSGGGQSIAEDFSAPLLAQLPLSAGTREGGDAGEPFGGPVYEELAKRVLERLEEVDANDDGATPDITVAP